METNGWQLIPSYKKQSMKKRKGKLMKWRARQRLIHITLQVKKFLLLNSNHDQVSLPRLTTRQHQLGVQETYLKTNQNQLEYFISKVRNKSNFSVLEGLKNGTMIKCQLFSYGIKNLEINSRIFFLNNILLLSKKARGLGENVIV